MADPNLQFILHLLQGVQGAVLAMIDSLWPSDRLLHAGIMPKRLQLRSCGLHWMIAPY